LRIGIVTTWFERGAAYVSRQYRDLLTGFHEVLVYARGGEADGRGDPRWEADGVTWARSVPTHGNTAFRLAHFQRWLKRERIELVLFNEQQWWPPVLLCQDLGIRCAAYVDYYTEETVPLFANYDLLICNTRRHHSVFSGHSACHHVPWGTRCDLFRPAREGPAERGRLTFFHSAGANPRRKGTDLALEALARLDAPARLVVHAQTPLARRLPDSCDLVRSLVAEGRLELHEREVHAPGLYHLGDVYLYPTRLEGIGLTVPEALASGLPVLVPDEAPMSEFVAGEAGRLVAVAERRPRADGYYWPQCRVDLADLVEQMRWYCERVGEIGSLRRAARAHAERALDWNRNAVELPGLLERARPLGGPLREEARRAALRFERRRVDPRYFFPTLARVLTRAGDFVHPRASRYSGRRGTDGEGS
jgi:glycosyltransferase involved in cell wall biosynthesis